MIDPWTIIGWGFLFLFVGLPIGGWLMQRLGRAIMYATQAEDRRAGPKKYQSWAPLWGGVTYRVNGDNPIMVSTDPNNMGGWHMTRVEWDRLVAHRKLVRLG